MIQNWPQKWQKLQKINEFLTFSCNFCQIFNRFRGLVLKSFRSETNIPLLKKMPRIERFSESVHAFSSETSLFSAAKIFSTKFF